MRTDLTRADNNACIKKGGDLKVPVVPLDDLLHNKNYGRIGMIKMDIEGWEPEAIKGGQRTIERDRPIILSEFGRERMLINKFSITESWDYLVNQLKYDCYYLRGRERKLRRLTVAGNIENLFFIPSETSTQEKLSC
jgi:hypothetical protein